MTRTGSSARSPMRNGRSSLTAPSTSALLREDAADAGEPFVGDDLDDGVDIVLGLELVGPAAFDGAAGQAGDADIGDFHYGLWSFQCWFHKRRNVGGKTNTHEGPCQGLREVFAVGRESGATGRQPQQRKLRTSAMFSVKIE